LGCVGSVARPGCRTCSGDGTPSHPTGERPMPLNPGRSGRFSAALALVLGVALTGRGEPAGLTLDQLKRMSDAELADLFTRSEVGRPPVGNARGKVVRLTDARLPRVRAGMQNVVWKGKTLGDDGAFVNRWALGVRAVASQYTIGPSWIDGRPAVVMEYPPGTPM